MTSTTFLHLNPTPTETLGCRSLRCCGLGGSDITPLSTGNTGGGCWLTGRGRRTSSGWEITGGGGEGLELQTSAERSTRVTSGLSQLMVGGGNPLGALQEITTAEPTDTSTSEGRPWNSLSISEVSACESLTVYRRIGWITSEYDH